MLMDMRKLATFAAKVVYECLDINQGFTCEKGGEIIFKPIK